DGLTGHPDQRLLRLHNGGGVVEGGQVRRQVARVRSVVEPLLQLCRVRGGQLVADLGGQFHDRGGPEAAVPVVVELDLGQGCNDVRINHGAQLTRQLCPMVAGGKAKIPGPVKPGEELAAYLKIERMAPPRITPAAAPMPTSPARPASVEPVRTS